MSGDKGVSRSDTQLGGQVTRRELLNLGLRAGALAATGALAFPGHRAGAAAATQAQPLPARALSLYNPHTAESLQQIYWSEGRYSPDGLRAIDHFFRDFRTGDVHFIDLGLIEMLHDLHASFETKTPLDLVSGFRSQTTNEALLRKSRQVSPRSFHIRGMAADIALPGVGLEVLHRAALRFQKGGVGYYPGQFVHMDVGPRRVW